MTTKNHMYASLEQEKRYMREMSLESSIPLKEEKN